MVDVDGSKIGGHLALSAEIVCNCVLYLHTKFGSSISDLCWVVFVFIVAALRIYCSLRHVR